eukprot:CAMPEP_0198257786 /NCGR_PEP_ID=MMETSP1447-20131203/7371_1 /TAXON_ID=420782 /ORGANISM="Chaetoceros dichaeta, Strain CCMP1751" /LENGTH=143 /DNA_ID=CAMNT_0043944767 /DNA_START=171 /DNA_END=599 /DNA_ORIENTATION=+
MEGNKETTNCLNTFVYATGAASLALGSALIYAFTNRKPGSKTSPVVQEEKKVPKFDKEKYPGGLIKIYYGSQTGTAESFSTDLKREGDTHGFQIDVIDLEELEDDIRGKLLDEQTRDAEDGTNRAVFMMATYGEGEPTDNAAE